MKKTNLLITLSIVLLASSQAMAGAYKLYMETGAGSYRQKMSSAKISIDAAHDNCVKNDRLNPSKSVMCTFNGKIIYKTKLLGYSAVRFVDGGGVSTKEIKRAAAYKNCLVNMKDNPNAGIICTHNGKYLTSQNATGTFQIFLENANKTWSLYSTVKRINARNALQLCDVVKERRPGKAILCKLSGQVLWKNAKVGISRVYINGGSVTTANVSRKTAVDVCQKNMKHNPNAQVICTFNNKLFMTNL